jgi:D-lactate dehydrogenase (cytochrome)
MNSKTSASSNSSNELSQGRRSASSPLIPYEPGDEASYAKAIAAEEAIVEAAISMDGTATGEHGVGIGKRDFMAREHGVGLQVMRAIKAALDPNGILNPGKVFDSDGSM